MVEVIREHCESQRVSSVKGKSGKGSVKRNVKENECGGNKNS